MPFSVDSNPGLVRILLIIKMLQTVHVTEVAKLCQKVNETGT